MTLDEKLAQLGSLWSFEVFDGSGLDEERARDRLADGIGQVTRVAGATNLPPDQVAIFGNQIQRFLVEETRLGIPAIIHEESLHGVMARDATCFPQSIGQAATWDPDARSEEVAGSSGATCGPTRRQPGAGAGPGHLARPALGPARGDVRRGPVPGRRCSAAPTCAASRTRPRANAPSSPPPSTWSVTACRRAASTWHPPTSGSASSWTPSCSRSRPPCARPGIGSVMHAYDDVDGVPCAASRELLTTILRERWGFDGIVVADYLGIEHLLTLHELVDGPLRCSRHGPRAPAWTSSCPRTARLRRTAPRGHRGRARGRGARGPGRGARAAHEVPARALRAALRADPEQAAAERPTRRTVALRGRASLHRAARERRDAAAAPRPRHASRSSAPTPTARATSWVTTATSSTSRPCSRTVAARAWPGRPHPSTCSWPTSWPRGRPCSRASGRECRPRPRSATRAAAGILDGDDADIAAAVEAARGADVAILVLGERSGLTAQCTCGETRDRMELGLPGRQAELFRAVAATGTPIVLVLVAGRPLAIPDEAGAGRCRAARVGARARPARRPSPRSSSVMSARAASCP